MEDILKINRAKWRSGGSSDNKTGRGETKLLNRGGYMCCLGFRCIQLGIPKSTLLMKPTPEETGWEVIPDLITKDGRDNLFCNNAIDINDDVSISQEQREKKIITHFAKKNVKVVFTGKYPNLEGK